MIVAGSKSISGIFANREYPHRDSSSSILALPFHLLCNEEKMTDQSAEHRCIIVLPEGDVFDTERPLNLMVLAVRNRDNDGPPDHARPPIFRWDSLPQVYKSSDLAACSNGAEPPTGQAADQPHEGAKQKEQLLIWDDRAERIKLSLKNELYKSVKNGHLNLWRLFCDIPKEPPSDLSDIDFWIATSTIYRSDLIKFCDSQKIGVEFDRVTPQPEAHDTSNQHNAESRKESSEDVNRPPHWADYEELARAFPSVGKTEASTLEWFRQGSGDRMRARGFKEAKIKGTGKKGRGHRTQFDIFGIARYLLISETLRQRAIDIGLRKHLGAAFGDYTEQYDDLFRSFFQMR